jgi:hypothetical protein
MTELVDRKFKVFFRRKGERKWATHVGFYDDEAYARKECARLKGPSWEVKLRIVETSDEII